MTPYMKRTGIRRHKIDHDRSRIQNVANNNLINVIRAVRNVIPELHIYFFIFQVGLDGLVDDLK